MSAVRVGGTLILCHKRRTKTLAKDPPPDVKHPLLPGGLGRISLRCRPPRRGPGMSSDEPGPRPETSVRRT